MSRPKIHVNPKFQPPTNTQVHINPNFVPRPHSETVVHVNPLFLQLTQTPLAPSGPTTTTTTTVQPLIRKTRHKLLRKNTPATSTLTKTEGSAATGKQSNMIKVGKNKLIKANIYKATIQSAVKPKNMYKIDNRSPLTTKRPKNSSKKNIQSRHKTLELKKINGTVYKTSKNRLERQRSVSTSVPPSTSASSNKQSDRLISLNGNKYILKENGKRLFPIKTALMEPSSSKTSLEIAGIRFIQLMDGTYVRHHIHSVQSVARQHLTTSKHKSIKILTKKLRKCNIPCPVFRRIGKCLAFTRGRCPKLHDPKFVDICGAALKKGGCTKNGCLMSHDLSLAKMPACKYFLQGCCVNDNCPYLHHKLNENVPLCPEFLKGYCEAKDQCDKRHEHPESKQKSTRTKRKITNKLTETARKKPKMSEEPTSSSTTRYFLSETSLEDPKLSKTSDDIPENDATAKAEDSRPPIGSMPAFIPI